MTRLRAHLSYANVVSTLCLFLVVSGGTAVALRGKNSVDSGDLRNGQVKSADIGKGQVKSSDIGAGQVRSSDIGAGQVGSANVGDGSLGEADVGANSLGPKSFAEVEVLEAGRVALGLGGSPNTSTELYNDGTFTLTGRCSTGGVPGVRAQIEIRSTVEGSSMSSESDDEETFGPNDVYTVAESATNPMTVAVYSGGHMSATAPNGRVLNGIVGAGANLPGGDCVFNLSLIG